MGHGMQPTFLNDSLQLFNNGPANVKRANQKFPLARLSIRYATKRIHGQNLGWKGDVIGSTPRTSCPPEFFRHLVFGMPS